MADLVKAQLAVMGSLAQEDVRRVQAAEERVAQCMGRLVAASNSREWINASLSSPTMSKHPRAMREAGSHNRELR